MSDGGHSGNGHRFPPVDPVGASLDEAVRDYSDVVTRLDAHGEALLGMAADVAAMRREATLVRADVHRCVDSVTAQALLLDGIERKLGVIAELLKASATGSKLAGAP